MRIKTLLTTAFVAVMLVIAADYTTYAATGGSFILGKPNAANAETALSRTTAGTTLRLNSQPGSAPLVVNRNVKATNLNADFLDGLDSAKFAQKSAPVRTYLAPDDPDRLVAVGAQTAVSTVNIAVPAECGTNTRHRYVIEHSAWWIGSTSTVEVSLTLDSTSHQFGPGTAVVTADPYANTATSRVVTLAPGAHVIRVLGSSNPAGSAVDPSLRVTDLGYNCSGGATSRHAGSGDGPEPGGLD